ncbi:MAG: hypothetical protein IKE06_08675 [Solobacterium sp.]|nr:hypothetical protein [Solobacterium sp.]
MIETSAYDRCKNIVLKEINSEKNVKPSVISAYLESCDAKTQFKYAMLVRNERLSHNPEYQVELAKLSIEIEIIHSSKRFSDIRKANPDARFYFSLNNTNKYCGYYWLQKAIEVDSLSGYKYLIELSKDNSLRETITEEVVEAAFTACQLLDKKTK